MMSMIVMVVLNLSRGQLSSLHRSRDEGEGEEGQVTLKGSLQGVHELVRSHIDVH